MKNKFYIFIILTILSFFLIKSSYSDEIKFDVTEIEIIDNGNKIISNKKGIKISEFNKKYFRFSSFSQEAASFFVTKSNKYFSVVFKVHIF